MTMQLQFDYCARTENNSASQSILESNKDTINNQCSMVKALLEGGYKLTVRSAMVDHGIGDLRRRVKDLRDYHGMNIQWKLIEGRFKEFYL